MLINNTSNIMTSNLPDNLDLKKTTIDCLRKNGIYVIEDLLELTEIQLLSLKGIGYVRFIEILKTLQKENLFLKEK